MSPAATVGEPRSLGEHAAASPARLLTVFLCAAFALLALYETGTALLAPLRVASAADWDDANREVSDGFHDGDLIVFAPAWADPVGRLHLGALIPPEMAARADASHYGRVWEVSLRNARAPETLGDDAELISRHAHGRVQVALYKKSPPVKSLYDFTSSLSEARVTQLRAGGGGGRGDELPCLHDGNAFRCAGTRVEKRILEVNYLPRRGVLAPADGQLTTRIAYDGVLLGDELVGYTGIHDYYSRKNSDDPVELSVFVDGVRKLYLRQMNDDGWKPFRLDTRAEKGTRHDVRFEVYSPAPRWRTFGFAAETIERGLAPTTTTRTTK